MTGSATVVTVSTAQQLFDAINQFNGLTDGSAYTINFDANITLSTVLPTILSASDLTINGAGYTLTGVGVSSPFMLSVGTPTITGLSYSGFPASVTVANAQQLVDAINTYNVLGGATPFTINFARNITVDCDLPTIVNPLNLTILGSGHSLIGTPLYNQ